MSGKPTVNYSVRQLSLKPHCTVYYTVPIYASKSLKYMDFLTATNSSKA